MPKRFPPFLCLLLLCAARTNLLLPRYTELKLTLTISSGWWLIFFSITLQCQGVCSVTCTQLYFKTKNKAKWSIKKFVWLTSFGGKRGGGPRGGKRPKEWTVQKTRESSEKQLKKQTKHNHNCLSIPFPKTISYIMTIYPAWLSWACPTYGLQETPATPLTHNTEVPVLSHRTN